MRLALVSTYELGHQPIHVATPAASLRQDGLEVLTLDLAVADWDDALISDLDAVAFSVPMHTALRLATEAARRVAAANPTVKIAAYGLYAEVADPQLFDRRIGGEYLDGLAEWARNPGDGMTSHRGRTLIPMPDRRSLPRLDNYARLDMGGRQRLVGAIETTHGCLHHCRHCPLPAVYDGGLRTIPVERVIADVDQLVSAGAEHVTIADADFFNGPQHALRVVRAVHERWPTVTYDATIKVEHLLQHRALLPELASTGCLFVVSAFETLNDEILTILDKGHTAAEAAAALHECRSVGLDVRPTWLPFTPWTTLDDLTEMFSFIAAHDLAPVTDPVQMSIRLLVPANSLLADHPAFVPYRGAYDSTALTFPWTGPDQRIEELAADLAVIAEDGVNDDPVHVFSTMWKATLRAAGSDVAAIDAIPLGAVEGRPRLTEPWFC